MDSIVINVGPLTSYSSLYYYLAPKLDKIREIYHSGAVPSVKMDLTHLERGSISISALTGFLTISKKVRDFLGYPIPATIKWDPLLQGFLADLEFFRISDKFKLFKWEPEGIIGGYRMGVINPDTKLLYYADINPIKKIDPSNIGLEKAKLKQKIAPHFLMRCANLFNGFNDKVEDVVSNTTLELIVNSLMHAEDVAFVGLQRTNKRITVAVCDGGIGFLKSLRRTYNHIEYFKELTHIDAIVLGSLIQQNAHGLRLAISEVLNYRINNPIQQISGWVIISSFNAEIRWQIANWSKAIEYVDNVNINKIKPDFYKIIGEPLTEFVDKKKLQSGYWKKYDTFLVGSRITFEIQVND